MAIRFHCQRCEQLLGIASRKAGTEIVCPKCALPQTVPSEEAAAMMVAAKSAATEPVGPAVSQRAVDDGGPALPGTILYRRRTLYVHGLLFLLLAAGAFCAGYVIGRADATLELDTARAETASQSVLVEGKLYYDTGAGSIAPDAGAVLIALPADKLPEATLPIDELRPRDLPPEPTSQSVRKIEDLGGVYARADELGAFRVVVPREGRYRVLLISRGTTRDEEIGVDELDLTGVSEYFYRADALIGPYKYRWTLQEITAESGPIEHNFGRSSGE